MIRVDCRDCGAYVGIDPERARAMLIHVAAFGFGRHVTDPRAFVMRALALHGWIYAGGPLDASRITMTCPSCRSKLPGLPVDPEDQAK